MTTARKGEDRGTTVPPEPRVRLGQVADAMIESGAGLPSAAQAGVHTDLLDQVIKTRPDLVAPLLRALDELGHAVLLGLGRGRRVIDAVRHPGREDAPGLESGRAGEDPFAEAAEVRSPGFVDRLLVFFIICIVRRVIFGCGIVFTSRLVDLFIIRRLIIPTSCEQAREQGDPNSKPNC